MNKFKVVLPFLLLAAEGERKDNLIRDSREIGLKL